MSYVITLLGGGLAGAVLNQAANYLITKRKENKRHNVIIKSIKELLEKDIHQGADYLKKILKESLEKFKGDLTKTRFDPNLLVFLNNDLTRFINSEELLTIFYKQGISIKTLNRLDSKLSYLKNNNVNTILNNYITKSNNYALDTLKEVNGVFNTDLAIKINNLQALDTLVNSFSMNQLAILKEEYIKEIEHQINMLDQVLADSLKISSLLKEKKWYK